TFSGNTADPMVFAGSSITFTSPVSLPNSVALSVNNTTTLAGVISGTGSLTLAAAPVVNGSAALTGTGNLVLTAANTFTGPTIVNAGTLTLSGAGALTG